MANHTLAEFIREEEESKANKLKRVSLAEALNLKPKGLLSSSSSAHDLRHIELEKEKENIASPIGVLEACMEEFHSHQVAKPKTSCPRARHWTNFFKLLKKKSFKRLGSLPHFSIPKIAKWKSKSSRESHVLSKLYSFNSTWVTFSLSELRNATNNYNSENIIGRGGFADVYKGCLPDGQLIAVKKLTKGNTDDNTVGFLSELGIIAHVDHPNTAKLVGCCVERDMQLVFELSTLGSLGSLLHGSDKNKLDWSKRYKIALGIADGLLYLHESCHRRIIHRDIKTDNILLTENFEPQICDFGLAKWLPEQWTHRNIPQFEGTFGYFAPEYFMHGTVDEKTDVYAFGVLLLEIITGRPAVDHLQQSVVIWAKPFLEANLTKDLVDPSLGDDYDRGQLGCVVVTASKCIEQTPMLRPCMSQIVTMLRSHNKYGRDSKTSRKIPLRRTYSEELLDAQEYNSTKYLRDLKRHQQIALGLEI